MYLSSGVIVGACTSNHGLDSHQNLPLRMNKPKINCTSILLEECIQVANVDEMTI